MPLLPVTSKIKPLNFKKLSAFKLYKIQFNTQLMLLI